MQIVLVSVFDDFELAIFELIILFCDFSGITSIVYNLLLLDFSEVFLIAKAHGGNISKIIGNTINVINDKIEVKLEIDTVTASKRFEQKLMNLLPFLIIIYMNISSSSFLKSLYTTLEGRMLMTFALVVYFFSIKVSKQILTIEV